MQNVVFSKGKPSKTPLTEQQRQSRCDLLQIYAATLSASAQSQLDTFIEQQRSRGADIAAADARHKASANHVTNEIAPVKESLLRIESALGIAPKPSAQSGPPDAEASPKPVVGIAKFTLGIRPGRQRALKQLGVPPPGPLPPRPYAKGDLAIPTTSFGEALYRVLLVLDLQLPQ